MIETKKNCVEERYYALMTDYLDTLFNPFKREEWRYHRFKKSLIIHQYGFCCRVKRLHAKQETVWELCEHPSREYIGRIIAKTSDILQDLEETTGVNAYTCLQKWQRTLRHYLVSQNAQDGRWIWFPARNVVFHIKERSQMHVPIIPTEEMMMLAHTAVMREGKLHMIYDTIYIDIPRSAHLRLHVLQEGAHHSA